MTFDSKLSIDRMAARVALPSAQDYDEDYFERGQVVQKSGYMNYSWMPEQTIRMAHYLIKALGISTSDRVLDYGCAKGFLVKALRILDIQADGVDISDYAISQVPPEVRKFCRKINEDNSDLFAASSYDLFLAKDVFEHITEDKLKNLLEISRGHCKKMFIAIPLGRDDDSGRFIVPEYDLDITHITVKPDTWWSDLFRQSGWNIEWFDYSFPGMKENWTRHWHAGNGFFLLS